MTDTTTAPELVMLAPGELVPHPDNPRADLGDLDELTASITAVGVLQPIIAIPDENGPRIVMGHRRHAAAVAAGLVEVPVLLRADLAGLPLDAIVRMLIENIHREALTPAEIVKGCEQLALGGMSATKIGKALGLKRATAQTIVKVARSATATAVVERYTLSLEHAAVIAEWDNDADAVKALTVTAVDRPHMFDHVLARLRREEADRERWNQAVAPYREQGLTVLRSDLDHPNAAPLHLLVDDDNQPLDDDQHAATCPGHALLAEPVDDYDRYDDEDQTDREGADEQTPELEITAVCLDPHEHGHRDRWSIPRTAAATTTTDPAPAEPAQSTGRNEAQTQERRRVIAHNKAWPAAAEVRRQYVRTLLQRKAVPKNALRFVVDDIARHPGALDNARESMVAEFLACDPGSSWAPRAAAGWAADHADTKLPFALLAVVAARHEDHLEDKSSWRNFTEASGKYLGFLVSTGYQPSELEQQVMDEALAARADTDTDDGPDAA